MEWLKSQGPQNSVASVSNFIVKFPTLLCSFQLYCCFTRRESQPDLWLHRDAFRQAPRLVEVSRIEGATGSPVLFAGDAGHILARNPPLKEMIATIRQG